MRAFLLAVLLISGVWAAEAQGVPQADATAIQGVITQQIDAFRQDNAAGAFGYASPGIKGMFGTPERFMGMVRDNYPAVHRPRSFDFGELRQTEGRIVQEVELVGPDGQPQLALYEMERGSDGVWRIAGCSLVRSPRVGA